jgi:superfamily I DNA/RNA helicase
MEAILKDLDAPQREAVLAEARYVLVAAPPGSGKTRVLAARLARLLAEGADPRTVTALTFTCRAAMEMSARVRAILGRDARAGHIGTFHALALRLLRAARPGLKIIGRAAQEDALRSLGIKNARKTASKISFVKNTAMPEEALADDLREAMKKYGEHLEMKNLLDLDDLVPEAAALLEGAGPGGDGPVGDVPGVLHGILGMGGPGHILVDEYQDINAAQVRFLRALASRGAGVFAIGDPDQAIYSFRGASLAFFLDFTRHWPGALVMNLATNYRSSTAVVEASSALIGHNTERLGLSPRATRPGGAVRLVECVDDAAEARYIINEIEKRMGGLTTLTSDGAVEDARFSDFAVLFRSRRAARTLLGAFGDSSLPYHVADGPGLGLGEFLSLLRVKAPGAEISLPSYIETEAREAGLADEVAELLFWLARRYEGAAAAGVMNDFIADAEVYRAGPETGMEVDKVNLLTLHAAKGLEFRVVFIIGAEDGLIPLRRDDTSVEEERRLFYVGITRATQEAVLTRAARRRLHGRTEETRPSPFLSEMDGHLRVTSPRAPKKRRLRPVQKGLFE